LLLFRNIDHRPFNTQEGAVFQESPQVHLLGIQGISSIAARSYALNRIAKMGDNVGDGAPEISEEQQAEAVTNVAMESIRQVLLDTTL
jgi:hypothetical protein